MDIGEFTVSDFGLEFARDKQESRSKESRSQDRNKRAPITTDAGAWANNPDELDYPGIDTPSENPNVLPKDLMHPAKTDVAAEARGKTGGTGAGQIPSGEAERSRLAATDISLAPGEAFEGVATVSRGDELGGNVLSKGERAPKQEPMRPPESALRYRRGEEQETLASQKTPGSDIAFVYENTETDLSLPQFTSRVETEKARLSGLADDFAAADVVRQQLERE